MHLPQGFLRRSVASAVDWTKFVVAGLVGLLTGFLLLASSVTMSAAMPPASLRKSMPGATPEELASAAQSAAWSDPVFWGVAGVAVVVSLAAAVVSSGWRPWRVRVDPSVHEILVSTVDPAVVNMRSLVSSKVLAGDDSAQQVFTEALAQRQAILDAGRALHKLPPHDSERTVRVEALQEAGAGVAAALRVVAGLHADAETRVEAVSNDVLVEEEVATLQSRRLREAVEAAEGRLIEHQRIRQDLQ